MSGREPQFGKIGPGSKAQGEQIPRLVGPYKKATQIQRSCEQRAIRNQSISSLKERRMYGHGAGSECAQYVLALHLQE